MIVVLAPVLVLAALGRLDRRLFTVLWIVPLAFIAANASPVQLLWQFAPGVVEQTMAWAARHAAVTVALRAALVVAWQVVGWWIVVDCLRKPREQAAASAAIGGAGQASGGRAREALP